MLQLNKENFQGFISNSEELLVVEFYKKACPHCNKLQNELNTLERESDQKVRFGRVNAQEEFELSDIYDVNVLPTLLYFIRGEVRERLEGYYSPLVILANMHKLFHLLS